MQCPLFYAKESMAEPALIAINDRNNIMQLLRCLKEVNKDFVVCLPDVLKVVGIVVAVVAAVVLILAAAAIGVKVARDYLLALGFSETAAGFIFMGAVIFALALISYLFSVRVKCSQLSVQDALLATLTKNVQDYGVKWIGEIYDRNHPSWVKYKKFQFKEKDYLYVVHDETKKIYVSSNCFLPHSKN